MPRKDVLRLRDISSAIETIQRYSTEHPDWHQAKNRLVRDAILYNFGVIGEAVKALSEDTKKLAPDADWSHAAKMRDFLIHQYAFTDVGIVAGTIENDLPGLKDVADDLLRRLD